MTANTVTVRLIAITAMTSSKLKPLTALRRFRKLFVSRMWWRQVTMLSNSRRPQKEQPLNTQSCSLMLGSSVGNVKVPGYTGHPDNGL
jgi:hypothetical protein